MRSSTYLIDVDGTIFKKTGSTNDWFNPPELLPGVKDFFQRIEKESAHIVLITARKKSCRANLENQLDLYELFYDQLIMGVTNGKRVMINDGDSELIRMTPNLGFKKIKDGKSLLIALINMTGPLDCLDLVASHNDVYVNLRRNGQLVEQLDVKRYCSLPEDEAFQCLRITARRLQC
jgi:hypothetical protein